MKRREYKYTVDEYKKTYGEKSLSGFFDVGSFTHAPAIPKNMYEIVAETIREINGRWIPGLFYWVWGNNGEMKRRITEAEEEMEVAIICEDEEGLRRQLDVMRRLWREAREEFLRKGVREVVEINK